MRDIFPVKYYSDEGFVEYKIEINEEDLEEIIHDYMISNSDIDFDEVEVVNNRPMNIWLYAKLRRYVDKEAPREEQLEQIGDAEVEIAGDYDDNPTGGLVF